MTQIQKIYQKPKLSSGPSTDYQKHKDLYRLKRDAFRSNPRAMMELTEWKQQNDDYDYEELSRGMVPAEMLAKPGQDSPFRKSDTWFSESQILTNASPILSESSDSYIIDNLASYDSRQYPVWLDPKFKAGHTPEGQGFGHCLLIPKRRVFNIVDPDIAMNDCAIIKEMKRHFISFWKDGGAAKVVHGVRSKFQYQNNKVTTDDRCTSTFYDLLPELNADFDSLVEPFMKLMPADFVFGFHAYPDNSVGHLHMHVYPRIDSLRRFSTKQHDWKTIPFDAVLDVEEEDRKRRAGEESSVSYIKEKI